VSRIFPEKSDIRTVPNFLYTLIHFPADILEVFWIGTGSVQEGAQGIWNCTKMQDPILYHVNWYSVTFLPFIAESRMWLCQPGTQLQ